MTDTDFDFSGGLGGAAAEEAFKNSRGPSYRATDYFRLDGSEAGVQAGTNQAIFRFFSDYRPPRGYTNDNPPRPIINDAYDVPWITVDQHSMVPTKPRPADIGKDDRWPQSMGCVCRNDKIFKARYGDCVHCAGTYGKKQRPSPRTWALCVLREEVKENGTVVGIKDQMKEMAVLDAEGKQVGSETTWVPDIRIINLGWMNFFTFFDGYGGRFGTVLDRDYWAERSGTDMKTTYRTVPMDRLEMAPNPDGSIRYYDLRDKALFMEKYPNLPDLRTIVAEQCADEFYDRFYVPGKPGKSSRATGRSTAPTQGPAAPTGPQGPAAGSGAGTAAGNEQPDTSLLDRLAQRVSGAPAQPPAQPTAQQPAQPAQQEQQPAQQEQTQTPVTSGGGSRAL